MNNLICCYSVDEKYSVHMESPRLKQAITLGSFKVLRLKPFEPLPVASMYIITSTATQAKEG